MNPMKYQSSRRSQVKDGDTIKAESEARIENRLALLRDTFGEDDARVHQVQTRIAELIELDTPHAWYISSLYATWATRYPDDILNPPKLPCNCDEARGWVSTRDEETGTVSSRPCARCNSKVFPILEEYWESLANPLQQRVVADDVPPPEEPWGSEPF